MELAVNMDKMLMVLVMEMVLVVDVVQEVDLLVKVLVEQMEKMQLELEAVVDYQDHHSIIHLDSAEVEQDKAAAEMEQYLMALS